MESSENQKDKLLILYIKAELQALVKEFPKVTWDLQGFDERNVTVLQTYQPGFSDLYHSVYMLIGKSQAKHWMKLAG